MNDVELREDQTDILSIPEGARHLTLQGEGTEPQRLTNGVSLLMLPFHNPAKALCQNRHAARLIDKIHGAAIEGSALVRRRRQSCEKDHRLRNALPAHFPQ